ncbi:response regulator [Gemmatimonas groenlandica]|uniref:Response regulator transcription factor n=1 Tax=Gemmatimonas groenlandica TaxID=2732249 RepID=A0A6M4INP0_9BACT|nr:response regulator transcription factor [Gemmatimonas groenlandica]QJR36343.1 response regulator transcription factor [Gemmatimonas groenlandica]
MRPDLIRVVLVDDHQIVRSGLKAVLSTAKDIAVVGEGGSGKDALVLAERLDPHVIVMDLSMPDMDGLTATRELQKANAVRTPTPGEPMTRRVLVLTMHTEDEHLVALLEAGAGGYLLKSVADRELVDAIRTVAAGDVYVQPTAARALARGLARRDGNADERARFEKLTDREQVVLKLVAEGFTAPEIGEHLTISPKTVDTYKQRIGEKLGLAHRSDYVKFALKLGLLKNDA